MANTNKPIGFKAVGHLTGGEIRTRNYTLTTGQIAYPGAVCKAVTGGTVEPAEAAIGAAAVGVFASYVDDSASAGGKTVAVWDDPELIFMVQCQTGDAPQATAVFSTGDHLATAGDSTLKQSRDELKLDTNGQFKIIGLYDAADNAWGEHAKVLVIFNEHLYKALVAGV